MNVSASCAVGLCFVCFQSLHLVLGLSGPQADLPVAKVDADGRNSQLRPRDRQLRETRDVTVIFYLILHLALRLIRSYKVFHPHGFEALRAQERNQGQCRLSASALKLKKQLYRPGCITEPSLWPVICTAGSVKMCQNDIQDLSIFDLPLHSYRIPSHRL